MPLRMLLDVGRGEPDDVILLGARNLDPPEREYVASIGLRTDAGRARGRDRRHRGVYVALDCDALEPAASGRSCPSPGA